MLCARPTRPIRAASWRTVWAVGAVVSVALGTAVIGKRSEAISERAEVRPLVGRLVGPYGTGAPTRARRPRIVAPRRTGWCFLFANTAPPIGKGSGSA